MVTFFRPFFGRVYQAFLSDNQLGSAYREMGSTISPPYLFLYAMFLINASILVYVILNYYGLSFYDGWLSILAILGTLCAVYLGKHLLLFIIKSIFPVAKEMDLYNFTIIIFNIVLGVLFIPFSLLIAYGPENLTLTIVYFSFFAIFLVYAYRIVRSLLIGGKYLSFSKFHFFMYLCTAEVAPLLIVIKYFLKQLFERYMIVYFFTKQFSECQQTVKQ